MAAVAAEPGAAAASTTAGEEVEFELESADHMRNPNTGATQVSSSTMDLCHQQRDVDAVQECSSLQMEIVRRPDIEAAGKALCALGDDEHDKMGRLRTEGDNIAGVDFEDYKLKEVFKVESLKEHFPPNLETANEVSTHDSHVCLLPSSISVSVSQPSVVFLHSLPSHPPESEIGLSLAEPAEPAIVGLNLESIDPFRELIKPSCETDPVPESACDAPTTEYMPPEDTVHECPQHAGHPKSPSASEMSANLGASVEGGLNSDLPAVPAMHSPRLPIVGDSVLSSPESMDSCPPRLGFETDACEVKPESKPSLTGTTGSALGTLEHLTPGSEVRVCLDHIIDDALVVSFRFGEKLFSGVLMDLSKRFGPYGIPITLHPKREYKDKPESMQMKAAPTQPETEKRHTEEATKVPSKDPTEDSTVPDAASKPLPHPWTSKPPPLFQEGAPYPPPIFIRDTYNQSLPQPLPRKIKRPKRRLYREEPTSIMNAIKLRPRQVLCDKCKGTIPTSDKRETRRGLASDSRADDAKRRRNDNTTSSSSTVKRSRNDHRPDEKSRCSDSSRRQSSGLRISSSSSSALSSTRGGAASNRVMRGVSSSTSNSSSRVQLGTKKVLQSKNMELAKSQDMLKMAQVQQRRQRDTVASSGSGSSNSKAMTRAAALQEANQKVHFTRRLQQISGGGSSISSPLPPRIRLKPQRYRNEENDSSPSKPPCLDKVPGSDPVSLPKATPLLPAPLLSCTSTRPSCSSTSPSSSSTVEASAVAAAERPPPCLGPSKPTEPDLSLLGPPLCQPLPQPQPEPQPEPQPPPMPESQPQAQLPAECTNDPKVVPEEEEGREEGQEMRRSKAGSFVVYVSLNPTQPDSSSTSMCSVDSTDEIKSSNSECSSTETFDFPPPGGTLPLSPSPGTSSTDVTASAAPSPAPSTTAASSSASRDERKRGKSHKGAYFSKNVSKCVALDGRTICVGDIVWAKIYGFPWWPARILAIQVSRKENGLLIRQEARVAWFGSPTTSFLALSQLAPFLENFQSRFDKKRKGLYRKAITEAARAAKQLTPEVRALLTQFET